MTARSSTQPAGCGNRSETSMPLWPYFRNVRRVPSSLALLWTNWYFASPNSFGRACPSSWFKSGLGSNVSRWLGPPAMNRKMTARALAGWCGGLGASGIGDRRRGPAPGSGARPAPGRRSRSKASRTNSRRVRVARACGHRVRQGTYRNPLRLNTARANSLVVWSRRNRQREGFLARRRRPAQRQPEGAVDQRSRVSARSPARGGRRRPRRGRSRACR